MRSAQREFPELAQFDGLAHESLLSKFKELDQERISLARLEVATAHYDHIPRISGAIGEVGVIRREIAKKRKHLPIRRLLREAGRAIQSIKPVFMMSPVSVAQYLEPGILDFDLLVIDEASQVKPVDALGAIARCHQIVVVGDDKQLPPTGFFDKIVAGDDEDDDESFQAGDVESILGLCSAQSMPSRMLEWHYRSRHHSLITVSNHEFYDNRLYVVPHPSISGSEGLVFRHIKDGVYDRGGKRTNTVEAQAVAEAVLKHAEKTPHLSLGVGTFSVAQRDAVLNEIEQLRKENPSCEEFFATGVNEPFFVKNLENIQGDKRDVIFISVGYGKDSSGYMTMGFGPLSAEGGERRLNVLITRARERCEVFSSITSDDIDINRTKSFGTRSFKAFLSFAQNGHLDVGIKTGRDYDSEFEAEVARALEKLGHQIDAQVGVAGFRIDLAVVDPDKPGRYLLGIECDGASYHSSRSARDRDRIRQAVLEDRGWVIHRIWSTDWFRRPQEQLAKVTKAVENAKLKWSQRESTGDYRDDASENLDERVPQQIERTESSSEDNDDPFSSLTIPYHEADFQIDSVIDWYGEDIHEIDGNKLAKVFHRVVEIEGPIHREEIARRIATLWGLTRTGKRILEAVSTAEKIAIRNRNVIQQGDFIDVSTRETIVIRNRETVNSSNLRKPEFLSPSEIEAALLGLVRAHYGINKDEAVTSTARLFGFRTTSQQLREVFENVIEVMIGKSQLFLADGKLSLEQ
jgi:very-short-patch-repair endonuclease